MPPAEPYINPLVAESQEVGGNPKGGELVEWLFNHSTEGQQYFNKQYGCTGVGQMTISLAYACRTGKKKTVAFLGLFLGL